MTLTAGDRLVDYDEVLTRYEPVIGLETHVELGTVSKMFCGCATTFGAEPNTQTCPVCLGMPGSLPVANAAAVEATIRIGLALGCRIASWSRFARKNYFYPDIPKGFQTSQYDEPLCIAGHLDVEVDGETYRVEIERVHLEEDTGKNLHVGGSTGRIHGADHSLIDFNRAGIPLVEIVTRPVPGAGAKAPEVKRRIILGTYALSSGYYDAYYGQAQKVRTLITREFTAAFADVDVLVSPTTPTVAFPIGTRVDDPIAMYAADLCTLPASLAGLPAISVPSGLSDGLPVGLQVMAPALADDRCYRVAAALEAAQDGARGHRLLDELPTPAGAA
jgi:hypothetical protein